MATMTLDEIIRQNKMMQKYNIELMDYLRSALSWLFKYVNKHNIPMPEIEKLQLIMRNSSKVLDALDNQISNETLQPSKKGKTDEDLTEPSATMSE